MCFDDLVRVMHWCLFIVCVTLCGICSAKECTLSDVPPDPKSECCGLANGNSVMKGTSIAEIDEYPWMALIEYKKQDKIKIFCSAILISGRYVMSAAQCFPKESFFLERIGVPANIRLGEYETTNEGSDCVEIKPGDVVCNSGHISVPIEKITLHPNYHAVQRQNDIALIRMARTVPYTDFIRPICLPSLDITLHPPKNLYMTVAGWGAVNTTGPQSNVLRRVHVPYVDLQICVNKYDKPKYKIIPITSSQLCAGSKNRDACRGDAGGPLMYLNRKTTELAGIVSYGTEPCGQDIPGVYTKVFAFKDWINSVIEEDSKSPPTTTPDTGVIYFRE